MFSTGSAEVLRQTIQQTIQQRSGKLGLAVFLAAGLFAATGSQARKDPESAASLPTVVVSALPEQARQTYRLVLRGGPFPYRKDGVVFGNRERLLPNKARGYYREYTVPTPGSADRGARRLVCGGPQPTEPDACFYTADHYASFRLIAR